MSSRHLELSKTRLQKENKTETPAVSHWFSVVRAYSPSRTQSLVIPGVQIPVALDQIVDFPGLEDPAPQCLQSPSSQSFGTFQVHHPWLCLPVSDPCPPSHFQVILTSRPTKRPWIQDLATWLLLLQAFQTGTLAPMLPIQTALARTLLPKAS